MCPRTGDVRRWLFDGIFVLLCFTVFLCCVLGLSSV